MDNKHTTIKEIVEHLKSTFGETKILVKDYWDSDSMAIGLTDKTGQYLVYISTSGIDKDNFYVALENPPINDEFPYTDAGNFQVSKEELKKIVQAHLKL